MIFDRRKLKAWLKWVALVLLVTIFAASCTYGAYKWKSGPFKTSWTGSSVGQNQSMALHQMKPQDGFNYSYQPTNISSPIVFQGIITSSWMPLAGTDGTLPPILFKEPFYDWVGWPIDQRPLVDQYYGMSTIRISSPGASGGGGGVETISPISPVPEPSTWLMLLAGVAVIVRLALARTHR